MSITRARHNFSIVHATVLISVLAVGGCHRALHPDEKTAVYNSLAKNDLRSVTVSQDREKGMITLGGIVGDAKTKSQAEQLATQTAPGYTITNHIQIVSADIQGLEKKASETAALDSAIEEHFKARLDQNRDLKSQNIQYAASGGTIYLKGSVKTENQKKEAEHLAKMIPQVHQVVNRIEVTARAG